MSSWFNLFSFFRSLHKLACTSLILSPSCYKMNYMHSLSIVSFDLVWPAVNPLVALILSDKQEWIKGRRFLVNNNFGFFVWNILKYSSPKLWSILADHIAKFKRLRGPIINLFFILGLLICHQPNTAISKNVVKRKAKSP